MIKELLAQIEGDEKKLKENARPKLKEPIISREAAKSLGVFCLNEFLYDKCRFMFQKKYYKIVASYVLNIANITKNGNLLKSRLFKLMIITLLILSYKKVNLVLSP